MKEKLPMTILLSLGVLGIILIPVFIFTVVLKDFQVKDFKEVIEVPFNTTFKEDKGNVCFGNKFTCKETTVIKTGEVDTSKLGDYKLIYTYKYKDKTLVKEQIVKVKDNEAPVITVEDKDFKVCPNKRDVNFPVEAIDDYEGDISSRVEQTLEGDQVLFK